MTMRSGKLVSNRRDNTRLRLVPPSSPTSATSSTSNESPRLSPNISSMKPTIDARSLAGRGPSGTFCKVNCIGWMVSVGLESTAIITGADDGF